MIFRDFPRIYYRGFFMLLNDTGEEGKSIERKEDSTKTHRKKPGKIQSGGKEQGTDPEC